MLSKKFIFWKPKKPIAPEERVPVTLLSGFLGSGKTTLLNHLLAAEQTEGLAVLVNDLGKVNIDASLVKRSMRKLKSPINGIVELSNGCICCSFQSELMDALLNLYLKSKPRHILIEASGVAEPKAILQSLFGRNLEGVSGIDFLRVANLVTVVDAANLEDHLGASTQTLGTKRIEVTRDEQRRPLEELLMEQVECADLIVLNKTDQVATADANRLEAYLRSLNDKAEVQRCKFGQIAPATLFEHERFNEEATMTGARWRNIMLSNDRSSNTHTTAPSDTNLSFDTLAPSPPGTSGKAGGFSLQAETTPPKHHHKDYGLDSFVYNSRRPFDEDKFLELMRSNLPGVVRAKGFYWTTQMSKHVGLVSIAGKILRNEYLGKWWIEMLADGEVREDEIPEIVENSWQPELGDRRQELVFIGIDLDLEAISNALRACEIDHGQ